MLITHGAHAFGIGRAAVDALVIMSSSKAPTVTKCALRAARLPRSTRAAYDEPRLLVPRGAESCVSGSRRRRRHSSRRRWRPWLLRRCRVPAQTATASAGLCRCHTVDSRRDRHLRYVAPTVRTASNTRSSGIREAASVAVSSIATRITRRIRAEVRCIGYADKHALRRVSGRAPDQAPLRVRAKDGCLPRTTVAPQGHGDALSLGSRGCRMGGSPTKSCCYALAMRQRWPRGSPTTACRRSTRARLTRPWDVVQ
jgi:hypothetical protein